MARLWPLLNYCEFYEMHFCKGSATLNLHRRDSESWLDS